MHTMTRHGWFIAMALISAWPALSIADEPADRKALEAASQMWVKAYNASDFEALMRLITDDVVLLDPTLPPVSGKRAAHGAWSKALERNTADLDSTSKEIEVAGEFAWRVATLTHRQATRVGKPTQMLEIWQRVGGDWKLRRQMSSGILAPSTPLRAPPEGPMLDSHPN